MFDRSQTVVRDLARGVPEAPVFRDPTGRRWRRIRVVALAVVIPVIVVVMVAVPHLYAAPLAAGGGGLFSRLHWSQLGTDPPVIGAGPLERVLCVRQDGDRLVGADPFTDAILVTFTGEDLAAVQGHPYVIEHYGYPQSPRRTVSLTFDDGPNGADTQGILDVLAAHHVPATFFVVGRNVAQQPDLVARMAREGHAIGIHTLDHAHMENLPFWESQWELVSTERLIRAATGHDARFWRAPYDSDDPVDEKTMIGVVARGQELGFQHMTYGFDTEDWAIDPRPGATVDDIGLPPTDEDHLTILLHDGGGDRALTRQYLEKLIPFLQQQGYTFQSATQNNPTLTDANAAVTPSIWDRALLWSARAEYSAPGVLITGLFWFAVLSVIVTGLISLVLALRRRCRRARVVWPRPEEMDLAVSVVIAAYNEEPVIARTVRSLLASDFPLLEVVVVDDGSTDGTADAVARVAAEDPRVVLVRQANTGKSGALNNGLRSVRGDIVVTMDADTVVAPGAVTNLVRHFAVDPDGRLGGVAGVVRVGNRRRNLLTRWQALEYLSQIGLERSAQDALGAISIVPGACAAWRREAILEAGGYSTATLAEDCDLALTLHTLGWRITQNDEALAFTEAPETVDDLLAQRTRWAYGTLQAMWKHRWMVGRPRFGALGLWVMPNYLLSIVVPVVFLPFVAVITVQAVESGQGPMLLAFFAAFSLVHAVLTACAIALMQESWDNLLVVPVYRLMYEPLRAYLLYSSLILALKGARTGWNKLSRTGAMDVRTVQAAREPVRVRDVAGAQAMRSR
ncbi:bifunctional polysaccharide deacetylase/glycosyltransferase family 2 protein [Raineyella sp.]|uniref:bifunctional polysaccharide deacetylase/glycosyltransferase family 2 protein n=1 Tax=Raineyella sp. TaxID=1911550 RepID=UPI002B21A2C6|nr:glycosyltransferase [Raineyella sp.]MEA5154646.1 glycosyltransferase [Raineyella sp.]